VLLDLKIGGNCCVTVPVPKVFGTRIAGANEGRKREHTGGYPPKPSVLAHSGTEGEGFMTERSQT